MHRLSLRNDRAEIARLTTWIDDLVAPLRLSPRTANALHLCLEEAVTNVVAHAFEPGTVHDVEVALWRDDSGLQAEITDDGYPFDPLSHVLPEAPEGPRVSPDRWSGDQADAQLCRADRLPSGGIDEPADVVVFDPLNTEGVVLRRKLPPMSGGSMGFAALYPSYGDAQTPTRRMGRAQRNPSPSGDSTFPETALATRSPAQRGVDGVLQQAGNRHRTDAARHRRDRAGDLDRFGERHIADQPPSVSRLTPTSITVAPGAIQSPRTSSRSADGGHDDVRATALGGEIARAGMDHGDGGVGSRAAASPSAARRWWNGPAPRRARPPAKCRPRPAASSRRPACTGTSAG